MDLALSDDESSIDELFRSFFEKECPLAQVRRAEPLGFDADLWARFSSTGATGMGLPETLGGSGAPVSDAALISESIGRSLAPLPFIEHFVATRLLARCLGEDPALPILAGSDAIATLALHPVDGTLAHLVPAGAVATHVLALVGDDLVLDIAKPPNCAAANFAASPLADRDFAPDANVDRDASTRPVIAAGPEGAAAHAAALDEWRALTANALVGLGQAAFDLGLDYAKERTQFGVAIGSFQALQHRFADLAVSLDGARLLSRKAAWAFEAEPAEARRLAGMALIFCGDIANEIASFALHVHGGYGVSEEYDVQLYFRRAKGWRLVLDDPAVEVAKFADELLGPVEGVS
jgi:alkylation response protein AidB-like acyl-CoA dehydrogenase